jgi:preprotein translocase subunit SecE
LVERRSPKPEVVGSSPSAPAKLKKIMKNPLRFFQEVKQEAFRITWPTKKDTMMGAIMVFALASIAAIFFLILDQILRFLLNLILTINF